MSENEIRNYLIGKEAYHHTEFIILENSGSCVIAMINRLDGDSLFSPIKDLVLVAHSGTCVLVEDRTVDTANNTALARKAEELGLSKQTTLIVRGLDDHVNFINHPDPILIQVLEVIPPEPPKLLRMVQHVLTYADLPAIKLEVQEIDIRDLADNAQNTEALLVPCRSSGLDFIVPTYFLDEHPIRHNWLLLGCERSLQIHEHFYGDRPLCVDICPRNFTHDNGVLQLIKCCLLEKDIEMDGHRVVVPWGSTLRQVEHALETLIGFHKS
ncbi:uncharacterized protein METZ01_LOCUS8699 [marine metagenome]|uniref:Uncharacterized protein n=1 Tax=marine metagenome TaxID=408172 RepID=A0A381NMM1_9ZZZZ